MGRTRPPVDNQPTQGSSAADSTVEDAPLGATERNQERTILTEARADAEGYDPTVADHLLDAIYGDHPHVNDGCHLDGGFQHDAVWQMRWERVIVTKTCHYVVPKGRVGRRFIKMLSNEFQGVVAGQWNSERPMCFAAVILQRTDGVRSAGEIRSRINYRLDQWEERKFSALVDDTEAEVFSLAGSNRAPVDDEKKARAFNAKVLSGRLKQATRQLTQAEGGGVLSVDGACTKTGRPVLEVLEEKHPMMRDPPVAQEAQEMAGETAGCFEPYSRLPVPLRVEITAQTVEDVAGKLSGAAGLSNVDSVDWQHWLL